MPKGCENIEDMPYDLARALPHCYRILNWYENLPEEDMPPQWMWPFEDELEAWFDNIKANKNSGSSDTDTPTDMSKNELLDVGDRFKR